MDETKTVDTTKPSLVESRIKVIVANLSPTVVIKDPTAKTTIISLDETGNEKVEVVFKQDNQ